MKALVTGASGFIGGCLVERLRAAGHCVRGLVRDPARTDQLKAFGAEPVTGDVIDLSFLRAAVRGMDVHGRIADVRLANRTCKIGRKLVSYAHKALGTRVVFPCPDRRSKQMDRNEIRQNLVQILEEETGQSFADLDDAKKLREELGLDSVDVVSAVMQVERRFRIRLTQVEMQNLATIGNVLDLLQAKLAEACERTAAA